MYRSSGDIVPWLCHVVWAVLAEMILFIHSCPKAERINEHLRAFLVWGERKAAALGSGVAERRDGGLEGTASATRGGTCGAGGGLCAVFSGCLFSAPGRMSVLLLVCLFQASVMWRFIHFQLRRWREHWHEQSSRRRAPATAAATKQQSKPLKRDSGEQHGGGTGLHGSGLGFSVPWQLLGLQGVPSTALVASGQTPRG